VLSIDKDTFYKGNNSNLLKYGDHIFYAYNDGIFKFNEAQDKFVKDSLLSSAFDDGYISGKLIYTPQTDKLWAFSKESIIYIQPQRLSTDLEVNKIPISNAIRNTVTDYESILNIEDEKYLFGTSFGYFIIDLDKIDYQSYKVQLNSIKSSNINKEELLLNKSQFTKLDNNFNNIEFNYYVTEYDKYLETEYQYQLVGMYDNWSPWSSTPSHSFNNLPFGSYTFNVRARVGNNIAENTASYTFQIDRPWYMSNLAIMVYVISVLLFSLMMHAIYRRYYKKQQKKIIAQNQRELDLKELENQQQLMRFKNESLELDIQSKNRELAVSTMSLIKKNEFLSTIKQELMNIKDNQQLKPVIGIIDRNLNNTNDWKMFEEAFNNADKDFLKKIKEKHKALTPNDLRLCAYLRLNLSSKEIAPLLNISARSVEVKRYRLRKKMNLPHESSLTNYILEI